MPGNLCQHPLAVQIKTSTFSTLPSSEVHCRIAPSPGPSWPTWISGTALAPALPRSEAARATGNGRAGADGRPGRGADPAGQVCLVSPPRFTVKEFKPEDKNFTWLPVSRKSKALATSQKSPTYLNYLELFLCFLAFIMKDKEIKGPKKNN